jgi:chromosomal replication initiation ATPase DnaA
MTDQLSFPQPKKVSLIKENYFISKANYNAVSVLENWEAWPSQKLILFGPTGSGKTHLSSLWAKDVGATVLEATDLIEEQISSLSATPVVVENIDEIQRNRPSELILFHLHNLLASEGKNLLMTSRLLPGRLTFNLEDLQSRVMATPLARLEAIDDELLGAVLVKMFADRQMYFPDKLLSYVLPRIERSYTALQTFVEELDGRAMSENRPVGKELVRDILQKEKLN